MKIKIVIMSKSNSRNLFQSEKIAEALACINDSLLDSEWRNIVENIGKLSFKLSMDLNIIAKHFTAETDRNMNYTNLSVNSPLLSILESYYKSDSKPVNLGCTSFSANINSYLPTRFYFDEVQYAQPIVYKIIKEYEDGSIRVKRKHE